MVLVDPGLICAPTRDRDFLFLNYVRSYTQQITLPGGVCGHCRCAGTRCWGVVWKLLVFCPGCTRGRSKTAWTGGVVAGWWLGWSPRDTVSRWWVSVSAGHAPHPARISLHLSMWVVGVGVAGFTHATDWITRATGRSHHPGWCSLSPCAPSRPGATSLVPVYPAHPGCQPMPGFPLPAFPAGSGMTAGRNATQPYVSPWMTCRRNSPVSPAPTTGDTAR